MAAVLLGTGVPAAASAQWGGGYGYSGREDYGARYDDGRRGWGERARWQQRREWRERARWERRQARRYQERGYRGGWYGYDRY